MELRFWGIDMSNFSEIHEDLRNMIEDFDFGQSPPELVAAVASLREQCNVWLAEYPIEVIRDTKR